METEQIWLNNWIYWSNNFCIALPCTMGCK